MSDVLGWLFVIAMLQGTSSGQLESVPRPPNTETAARSSQPDYDSAAEQELLKLANQSRAQSGLSPLQAEDCLRSAARQHAAAMAEHDQVSHQFAGEAAFNQRMAANCTTPMDEVAENVAEASDASGAHQGFIHSPGHRENLLHPSYNAAGIGVVRRGSRLYVVEDFAHSSPAYSSQHAVELIGEAIDRARDAASLPRLRREDNGAVQSEACALAHADSLRASAAARPGEARYILRFTTMQPDSLPAAALKALREQNVGAYAAGACFAHTASYPTGAYWVVLHLK